VQQLYSLKNLDIEFYVWNEEFIVHLETKNLNFSSICRSSWSKGMKILHFLIKGYNIGFQNTAIAFYMFTQDDFEKKYEMTNEKQQTVLMPYVEWEYFHQNWVERINSLGSVHGVPSNFNFLLYSMVSIFQFIVLFFVLRWYFKRQNFREATERV
jgi:hypothetical protein